MSELIFLKLGGSLITDKTRPYTLRPERLAALAEEIAAALRRDPDLRLVLGHGSGSFGHTAAKEHKTRLGLPPNSSIEEIQKYWRGFAEVGYWAAQLNRHVMQALRASGIPALSLSPLASVTARDGQIANWPLKPLEKALRAGLVPVIYGDIIFDEVRGGTILSTEDLFLHLARHLRPKRILLAGLEAGVWADFPARTRVLDEIRPGVGMNRQEWQSAAGADVTGGMQSKVEQMLLLVQETPGTQARIFSGEIADAVTEALQGKPVGTLIRSE